MDDQGWVGVAMGPSSPAGLACYAGRSHMCEHTAVCLRPYQASRSDASLARWSCPYQSGRPREYHDTLAAAWYPALDRWECTIDLDCSTQSHPSPAADQSERDGG